MSDREIEEHQPTASSAAASSYNVYLLNGNPGPTILADTVSFNGGVAAFYRNDVLLHAIPASLIREIKLI